MTIDRIKNTTLWKNSLAEQNDEHSLKREELRSALLKFRENTSQLVSRISSALPGLTQHDITHLDALWETASLICGKNYELNPLEAFVFGGAVLLHDSALCFEAYDDGLDGIRNTITWKDYFSSLTAQNNGLPEEELKSSSDFFALRSLHAQQAEKLNEKSWVDPETQQPLFLIENATLRKHLGELIGQIASSHHWDIEDIESKLSSQINALPSYPREWRIDPIKLACILRCADATHIDNERAPDFLHALIKRKGISYKHWLAQNKLACVDIDQSDPTESTLLYTSTRNFSETESEAWWIAYDAICMINREIRASNALLESLNKDIFQVKRVKGVESPELMAKHIKTEGWNPCIAEIHVGNIEGLINSLGGEKLYGSDCDKLEVTIRELIQNARDSIQARRIFDDNFKGRVTVRLRKISNVYWLYVEDDGVGMSKRVLTGSLLDFGTSFWTSSLVQSEFPGLRSSSFKAVGKFGIGFYSIFMCADEVYVASRQWKEGFRDVWQVCFKNGLSLRPILKNSAPDLFFPNISTQVSIKLKADILKTDTITIKRNSVGCKNIDVSIIEYIAAICAGLDVSVFFSTDNSEGIEVHPEIIGENNKLEWLTNISFSKYQSDDIAKYVSDNSFRLKPIIEDGKIYGMAAISTLLDNSQNFLSIRTVGGLSASVHARGGDNYLGYIDYLPQSASRRDGNSYSAPSSAIKSWAKEQLRLLNVNKLNHAERYALASSLCDFEIDPSELASILIVVKHEGYFFNFKELAELALTTNIAIFKSGFMDHIDSHHTIDFLDDYALVRPLNNGKFLSLKMEDNKPKNNNSILDCLYRAIIKVGYLPHIIIKEKSIRASYGAMDLVIISAIKP